MGGVRRKACALALGAVVACASPPPRTSPQYTTRDPCRGRPTTSVRARLAEGKLVSALRVSEWACVDDATRRELEEARAWLAEPSDPDAVLAEALGARARGDQVLARRLFDRAAVGMQAAGSPPRWELPGPLTPGGMPSSSGARGSPRWPAGVWPSPRWRPVHAGCFGHGRAATLVFSPPPTMVGFSQQRLATRCWYGTAQDSADVCG